MSTPSMDRAAEALLNPGVMLPNDSTLRREILARAAVSAALHGPDDDVIARALARRWWDRNADDTDLWDDLTEAEQANVIANMNAADLADAVRAAILGEAS